MMRFFGAVSGLTSQPKGIDVGLSSGKKFACASIPSVSGVTTINTLPFTPSKVFVIEKWSSDGTRGQLKLISSLADIMGSFNIAFTSGSDSLIYYQTSAQYTGNLNKVILNGFTISADTLSTVLWWAYE